MTMTIVYDIPRRLMNGLDTSSNHFRSSDLLSILFLYNAVSNRFLTPEPVLLWVHGGFRHCS